MNEKTFLYNDKLLNVIQIYNIFNGTFKEFELFLNNDDVLSFDLNHFIIIYNDDKEIIYAKQYNTITQKENKSTFGYKIFKCMSPLFIENKKLRYLSNLFKTLYFKLLKLLRNKIKRKQIGCSKRFTLIKKDNFSKIFNLDKNLNILLLEIPNNKKNKIDIIDTQGILEDLLLMNRSKARKYFKENIGSNPMEKILLATYSSISVSSIFYILSVYPYAAINDSEILLAIKLFITAFISIFSLYLIITFIPIIPGLVSNSVRFTKSNSWSFIKVIVGIILIIYSIFSILASIYNHKDEKIYPIQNLVVNFYIDSKTTLVYDKNLNKPILFLGIKDGVYYYYDAFNIEKLIKRLKNTSHKGDYSLDEIKKMILNINNDTNEILLNGSYKIASIKNLSFDYNDTLIMQKMHINIVVNQKQK